MKNHSVFKKLKIAERCKPFGLVLTLFLLESQPSQAGSSGEFFAEHNYGTQKYSLLAQSYTPGQPIKLHDYSKHNAESAADAPNPGAQSVIVPGSNVTGPGALASPNNNNNNNNNSNNSNQSVDNNRLPDLIPPMDLSEPAGSPGLPAIDTNSATTSSTTANATPSSQPEKHHTKPHHAGGLSDKIKHFAGDVLPEVVGGAAEGYAGGGVVTNQQGRPSMSNLPGVSGGSGRPGLNPLRPGGGGGGGGGGAGVGGEMGMELNKAIQAEQAGNYYNAAQSYWYTVDLAVGGLGFKQRKDFWENGKIGPYRCHDLYERALKCHVIMYRGFLDQGKTWGINCDTGTFATALFKDLECLGLTDSQEPSWYYLEALNDIAVDKQELAHVRAYWLLGTALQLPNCSAELKAKCNVLREHIRLAAVVELADENRAKFENMAAQVWGQEHPTTTIYRDQNGNVTHVIDAGAGFYRYYYPLMKEMLKNDYPKFKASFAKLLAYVNSLPNNAVAIPPGDGAPKIIEYKIKQNEDISYGPVHYRIGGHF